jgi:hypothetical protein
VRGRWVFHLPIEAKSQNQLSGNKGGQRWAYKAHRDDLGLLIKHSAQQHGITPATGLRRVVVTRLYGHRGRRMDRPNLVGGCKPVLDALVRAKLLRDDSERWCIDHYAQRKVGAGAGPGILVELEEL